MLFTSVLGVMAGTLAVSTATPVKRADPATVTFAPYKYVGCRQDENPKAPQNPTVYNVTVATGCLTPAYAFASYVDGANAAAASSNCTFTIYSGTKCTGTAKLGKKSTSFQCYTNDDGGASVKLTCK